ADVHGYLILGGSAYLYGEVANTLAQRNGTNPQTLRIYNTYTDGLNYDRLNIGFSGTYNAYAIVPDKAGTGTYQQLSIGTQAGSGQNLNLMTQGVGRWALNSAGHINAVADNTYDIGASGANRPRNVFIGGSIVGRVKAGIPVDADFTNP